MKIVYMDLTKKISITRLNELIAKHVSKLCDLEY